MDLAHPRQQCGSIWAASSLVTATAAVVGVLGVLLLRAITVMPDLGVLALTVAAQVLVCALMLAPERRNVSWKLAAGCMAPGFVLTALSAADGGYWAAFWLVGLPGWILLCRRWSGYPRRRKVLEVLGFAGLYAGASLLFGLSMFLPNPVALLLPLVPAARLYSGALPVRRNVPALAELVLSVGLVVLVIMLPVDGWGATWSYAGAAVTGVLVLAAYTGRGTTGRRTRSLARA